MKKKLLLASLLICATLTAEEVKIADFFKNTNVWGMGRLAHEVHSPTTGDDISFSSIRLRLYFDTKINDKTNFVYSVNAGDTAYSGGYLLGTNPKNQGVDYRALHFAHYYANYKLAPNHSISVGKMDTPMVVLSDMFDFDGQKDAIVYKGNVAGVKINAGYLYEEKKLASVGGPPATSTEVADDKNTIFAQGVKELKLGKDALLVEGIVAKRTQAKTSTADDVTVLSAGAAYTLNTDLPVVPMVKVDGEIVMTDADDKNLGYTVGVLFGDQSTWIPGGWQGEVEYRYSQANSFGNNDSKQIKITGTKNIMPKVMASVEYKQERNISDDKDKDTLSLLLLNYF